MRELSSNLTAAQKKDSRVPAVRLQAKNLLAGVVNLKWNRLYTGSEPDGCHTLTLPGDGSLVRARVTPASDNRKLYRQRVVNPGPGSDYSQWAYLDHYNVVNCALCSLGSEVSLVWVISNGQIGYQKSPDNGATWQSPEYIGSAPTAQAQGLSAAYQPNGDIAVFFTDAMLLYVIQRIDGEWQSAAAWDKDTGRLTGIASVYEADWKLLVCGQDTAGNFKIWSLVYGNGGEAPAGAWTDLKELASAPADGDYEFSSLYLDRFTGDPPVAPTYRCFYVEKFAGDEACHRPYWSHTLPGTTFLENRWREPVPFGDLSGGAGETPVPLECPHGLALAHSPTHAWLSMPAGVWRASLAEQTLDLSEDVLAVKQQLSQESGELIVDLRHDPGRYSDLPTLDSVLDIGCQIEFSPGYRTSSGNEYSPGLIFRLQAYEHHISTGKAALILYCEDGWSALEKWIARYQFRWNTPDRYGQPVREASVKEVLTQVLARCGLKLSASGDSSETVNSLYPDFTVHPGDSGKDSVERLLSFVPDVLYLEGDNACLVNPQEDDAAVYHYGPRAGMPGPSEHIILEGRYRTSAPKMNRVKVEGLAVTGDIFNWAEIRKQGDILKMVEDLNLTHTAEALARGAALLRKAAIESGGSYIRVPVNCGQQLFDVVSVTDPKAGLAAAKKRVLGINLVYVPARGEYEQKLILGEV